MPEPRRVPPPRSEADLLARDTRPAALTGNGGAEAWRRVASRRRLAITRFDADA